MTGFRTRDMLDPARAAALQATLGMAPSISAGDALPPFFHQAYFWQVHPPGELGRDGHPRPGLGAIPDTGLPRRMWAGGRLEFHAPLVAGSPAEKTTTLHDTTRKQGRTGPLAFVTLRHEITQDGSARVTEWQDLVYRDDPAADAPAPAPPEAPRDEASREEARFDTTMLFRYSALTFNGHRIHYDAAYAREVEGYAGLVTHGPLLAQLLMLMAARQLGGLRAFSFRATAPLVHGETAQLCWKPDGSAWVRGPYRRLCMTAKAR